MPKYVLDVSNPAGQRADAQVEEPTRQDAIEAMRERGYRVHGIKEVVAFDTPDAVIDVPATKEQVRRPGEEHRDVFGTSRLASIWSFVGWLMILPVLFVVLVAFLQGEALGIGLVEWMLIALVAFYTLPTLLVCLTIATVLRTLDAIRRQTRE